MVERVRRPAQFEQLLTELTKESNIFETYKDALVFAACLGFRRGRRVQFEKSGEPINLQVFSAEFDEAIMNTLAMAAESNPDPYIMSLERVPEKLLVFEEYACGGLEILQNLLSGGQYSMQEVLLSLILDEQRPEGILEQITQLAGTP